MKATKTKRQRGKKPGRNGSANGRSKPKTNHGRIPANGTPGPVEVSDQIVHRPLREIHPSPNNDRLYRPVDRSDPDFRAFVKQVRINGITDPLIITIDGYIISGHRRYAAAEVIGLTTVPCRVAKLKHSDPRFLPFLRDCNRQRAKSIDEVLREEIVSADPEESHAALLQHRREAARIRVETGVIVGETRRSEISPAKEPLLLAIQGIIARLQDFWPLSDRLIHYQLLNDPPLIHASKMTSTYRNDLRSYKALTELVTRARIAGLITFDAIHDPTRPVTTWDVFRSPAPFIRREVDQFLKGYFRDLQAPQPLHVEILGEKNTVEGIIRPVAAEYCIPFTLGRGYSSLPPRHKVAQRFRKSGKEGLLLLVLSDHDPEGEDIPHSFARSMRDDFDIEDITFCKVALTGAQVEELALPPGLTAKEGSSRRRKFVERHGEHVYELEAVQPERLQATLRAAIANVIDMGLYRAELGAEKRDAAYLDNVRRQVHAMLGNLGAEGQES